MDLKKFLPKKTEPERHYFWSLIIEPGWVQAGIWRIEEKKAQIVLYSPPFSWETDEDLISAGDNALSSTIQGFPEDIAEPTKTVFGVSASWVSEGQIKNDYLAKIKKLCSELTLNPIGFVVIPEAIAHLVKSEEGSPLNAIVLGVYKDLLEITLFKLGVLLGTTQVARSVSASDDMAEGLTRFGQKDAFPSRILLYDGRESELEEVRQLLLRVNWEDFKDLKFLHTPKIEIVNARQKVFAVSLAGASEMASVTSVEVLKKSEEERQDLNGSLSPETEFEQEEDGTTLEELGFVLEKDIAQEEENPPKEISSKDEKDESYDTESDIDRTEIDEIHRNIEPVSDREAVKMTEKFAEGEGKETDVPRVKKPTFFTRLLRLKDRAPKFGLPKRNTFHKFGFGFKNPVVFAGVLFVLLLVLGFTAWWFYPKAVVTIYVSPQHLEDKFDITVDSGKDTSDFPGKVLAGEILQTKISGEKTKDTTGTKVVGEKAKGEITLYRVGSQMSLPEGTILYGPENLKFTLDKDVTVASGSAGLVGEVKASVVAENIGAEYNLASGATFRVGNFTATDLEAKNEAAFSGGTSREITAVSAEDLTSLEEDLREELVDQAKKELGEKISEDTFLIEESYSATSSSRTFSNKVGDEADTLKLSLGLTANSVAIQKNDIVELAKEVLKDKIPEGFVLRGEQMDFEFKVKNSTKSIYGFEVRIAANLLPEIDTEVVVDKIRGKYPDIAEDYLNKEVPGFVRADIRIRPRLPERLKTLPHVTKNIEVEIAAER